MSALRNLLLAVLGGVSLAMAFPDTGVWPLAFVGIGLLYLAIARARAWAAFGLGLACGLAFYLPYVVWARIAVGPVPWVALSLACATFVGVVAVAFSHVRRAPALADRPAVHPWVFAVMWVCGEILLGWGPFGGFPWGKLAFAVVDAPVVALAAWGGTPLVSGVVAGVGALLGAGVLAFGERRLVFAVAAPLLAVVVVLAPLAVPLDGRAQSGTLTVGWAQGNVPNEGLDSFAQARRVTTNHVEATERLAQQLTAPLDLMIWPENASDMDPRRDDQTATLVTHAAQVVNAPLILGSIDLTPPLGRYNVSLVWLPTGESAGEYRKQRPAAFAEYIPIRSIARHFSPEVDRVTRDVLPGTEPAVLPVWIASAQRDVPVGTIICFEVAYDAVVRDAVNNGAEFVAVQTNNATFGVTAESTQQLAMTRFRAIETGRMTLQVSTVGVSAVVTPAGRVLQRSELFTQDFGVAEVPLRTSITPAVRWGGIIEWVALACGGGMLVGAWVTRAGRKNQ